MGNQQSLREQEKKNKENEQHHNSKSNFKLIRLQSKESNQIDKIIEKNTKDTYLKVITNLGKEKKEMKNFTDNLYNDKYRSLTKIGFKSFDRKLTNKFVDIKKDFTKENEDFLIKDVIISTIPLEGFKKVTRRNFNEEKLKFENETQDKIKKSIIIESMTKFIEKQEAKRNLTTPSFLNQNKITDNKKNEFIPKKGINENNSNKLDKPLAMESPANQHSGGESVRNKYQKKLSFKEKNNLDNDQLLYQRLNQNLYSMDQNHDLLNLKKYRNKSFSNKILNGLDKLINFPETKIKFQTLKCNGNISKSRNLKKTTTIDEFNRMYIKLSN